MLRPYRQAEKLTRLASGLTLIELLLVVVLMVIVTGAGFTLFQIGARQEARQQDLLNQSQNLRAALYSLARDIRMAGNGLGFIGINRVDIFVHEDSARDIHAAAAPHHGWFRYQGSGQSGVRAIYGFDGDEGDDPDDPDDPIPDVVTIFRAEMENPLPLGRLGADFTPGRHSQVILQDDLTAGTIEEGDMVAVASGTRAVVLQALTINNNELGLVSGGQGGRFYPGTNNPLPDAADPSADTVFPSGSSVYNLRDIIFVTYYIERGENFNRLMANYHDHTVSALDEGVTEPGLAAVAGNIENMQLAYYVTAPGKTGPLLGADYTIEDADPVIDDNVLDGTAMNPGAKVVRMVNMILTSRSSRESSVAGTEDGHSRQILTENVNLRNFNSF